MLFPRGCQVEYCPSRHSPPAYVEISDGRRGGKTDRQIAQFDPPKNRQIETQNELLKGLSERLREGNILIGSLQQQLALPEAAHHQRQDVVQSSAEPMRAEEGIATEPLKSENPEKSVKAKAKKRGVFRRLFRR